MKVVVNGNRTSRSLTDQLLFQVMHLLIVACRDLFIQL